MKYLVIIPIQFFSCCKNEPIIYPDGGYTFINTDTMKDKSFPYFPVRDLMDTRDSLNSILMEANIMKLYNEPNISLKPSEKEIFRLTIDEWCGSVYYITLSENKIIAKKGSQNNMFEKETNPLSENDRELYYLLEMYLLRKEMYEKGERKEHYKINEKRQIDSCKKIGIAKCYKYLYEKSPLLLSKSYKYETRIINLPYHIYKELIDKINNAGYWNIPLGLDCINRPTDGIGFSLEANNGKKYNFVSSGDCMDSPSDFKKACQEIINHAHYEKEIRITHTENSLTNN
jgi:hypothetical protein